MKKICLFCCLMGVLAPGPFADDLKDIKDFLNGFAKEVNSNNIDGVIGKFATSDIINSGNIEAYVSGQGKYSCALSLLPLNDEMSKKINETQLNFELLRQLKIMLITAENPDTDIMIFRPAGKREDLQAVQNGLSGMYDTSLTVNWVKDVPCMPFFKDYFSELGFSAYKEIIIEYQTKTIPLYQFMTVVKGPSGWKILQFYSACMGSSVYGPVGTQNPLE